MRQKFKVIFKSRPFYYYKEKLGIKNNTLRKFDLSQKNDRERKFLLDKFIIDNINLKIVIKNTSENKFFEREVMDVSIFEGWYIITWKLK
jgi:hypothetical protein